MATNGTRPVGQVRGVLAEQVIVSTTHDPFLSVRALMAYSGLSLRTLRRHLSPSSEHPIPSYKVGGKIVVRRSEFDTWMHTYYRRKPPVAVDVEVLWQRAQRGGRGGA